MAHFAKLDENNVVTDVIVMHNDLLIDENGIESEEIGINVCKNLYGGRWIQTSYNGNFRVRYAGIGYRYDESLDAFISPCIYSSWNLVGANWEPPIPFPNKYTVENWPNEYGEYTDDHSYYWDEETQSWVFYLLKK